MKIINFFKLPAVILCLVFSVTAQDPEPVPSPPVVGEVTVTATKANIDPLYVELRKLSAAGNDFVLAAMNDVLATEIKVVKQWFKFGSINILRRCPGSGNAPFLFCNE